MAIPIDNTNLGDKYKKYLDKHKTYLSELNVTTSDFSPLPSGIRPIITTSAGVNVGYWPDETSLTASSSSEYYANVLYTNINKAVEDEKLKKEEKEKKEMANAKMCDICGAVYSTKKYTKIFDDMEENYDIHLRFFDSCSNDIEICPDCYKALIDKLVERGLEPVEEEDDDKKDDD